MFKPEVMPNPVIHPYMCFRCRCTTNKRYFVDTGMDTEFDGRIYLCADCVQDTVAVCPDVLMLSKLQEASDAFEAKLAEQEKAYRQYTYLRNELEKLHISTGAIIAREEEAENARRLERYNAKISDGAKSELANSDSRTEQDHSDLGPAPITLDIL